LDDARVPDKGIKVRCARCKHVFMAKKDTPSEETEFDFLLSGLGASASNAETGVSQPVESVLTSTAGGEGRMFAEGPETAAGETSSTLAVTGAEQAGREDFSADFFADKEVPAAQKEHGFEHGEFPFEGEDTAVKADEIVTTKPSTDETERFEFGEFPFKAEETTEQSGVALGQSGVSVDTEEFDFGPPDIETDKFAEIKSVESQGVAAEETKTKGFLIGEESAAPRVEDQAVEWQPETMVGEEKVETGASVIPPLQVKEEEAETFVPEVEKEVPDRRRSDMGVVERDAAFTASSVIEIEEIKPQAEEKAIPVEEKEPVPAPTPPTPSADEDLPPLAISTRKKGTSFFTIVVTAIAVLIVLAIVFFGFYVFKEGPAAFDKLKLSSLGKLVGLETGEGGSIAIKNPQGAFMVNREAGEIFVVSGEAVNNYKNPRASIQVKATVLGPKGEKIMQKTAYCGNLLSKEQLTTLPMSKIEEAMASPFGDSLANLGVQPGKEIPFVVVFSGVPKNAGEFSVEVIGSTVATQ
jgi:hypothetical protein